MPTALRWGILAAFLAFAPSAHALDLFEIQVYQAEVNAPGQVALELHTNHTLRGRKDVEWEGQVPANRATRMTLEPAIGVTEWFELGAYFQMMHAPDYGVRYGGAKLRGKFVVPERISGRGMFGLNVELGRVPKAVEEEGWANELRPIVGYKDERFLVSFNPIIGYALTGPERFRLDFEPALKGWVNTRLGFAVGAEYYAGLGRFDRGFSKPKEQEHLALLAFDLVEKPGAKEESGWELNVAVGRGFGPSTAQEWLLKTIVGKSF